MTTTMNSSTASSVAVLAGATASLALVAVYLGVVSLANSPAHASELVLGDWYFVAAIALGFGIQSGLFVYLRLLAHRARGLRASGALAAAGTGSSTAAMVACCAHHVADVLPLLGVSGAAVFVNDYRVPVMVAGLAVNLAGVVVLLGALRQTRASHAGGAHLVTGGNA